MLIRPLEYDRGLNLLDTPDMGDHLFVGRDDELEQMKTMLFRPKNAGVKRYGRYWQDSNGNSLFQTTSHLLLIRFLGERDVRVCVNNKPTTASSTNLTW
jgi:hypothetical protein